MLNKKQLDIQEGKEPVRNPNKIYQSTIMSIEEKSITKLPNRDTNINDRLDGSILTGLLNNKDVIKWFNYNAFEYK